MSLNTPHSTGPSCLHNVVGAGKKPASVVESPQPDLVLPARPPATYAAYHQPRKTPNALDDFFGAGAPEAHRPLSPASVSAPPPYAPFGHDVVETHPGVYSIAEPPTLARMLFLYGFRGSLIEYLFALLADVCSLKSSSHSGLLEFTSSFHPSCPPRTGKQGKPRLRKHSCCIFSVRRRKNGHGAACTRF